MYAVDVGHGQLVESLRGDPRVVVREGLNLRHLKISDLEDQPVDFIVGDVSFISLRLLLAPLLAVLTPRGQALLLVNGSARVEWCARLDCGEQQWMPSSQMRRPSVGDATGAHPAICPAQWEIRSSSSDCVPIPAPDYPWTLWIPELSQCSCTRSDPRRWGRHVRSCGRCPAS